MKPFAPIVEVKPIEPEAWSGELSRPQDKLNALLSGMREGRVELLSDFAECYRRVPNDAPIKSACKTSSSENPLCILVPFLLGDENLSLFISIVMRDLGFFKDFLEAQENGFWIVLAKNKLFSQMKQCLEVFKTIDYNPYCNQEGTYFMQNLQIVDAIIVFESLFPNCFSRILGDSMWDPCIRIASDLNEEALTLFVKHYGINQILAAQNLRYGFREIVNSNKDFEKVAQFNELIEQYVAADLAGCVAVVPESKAEDSTIPTDVWDAFADDLIESLKGEPVGPAAMAGDAEEKLGAHPFFSDLNRRVPSARPAEKRERDAAAPCDARPAKKGPLDDLDGLDDLPSLDG